MQRYSIFSNIQIFYPLFSLYLKNHRGLQPPVTFIYFCMNIVFLRLSLCLTAKCSYFFYSLN